MFTAYVALKYFSAVLLNYLFNYLLNHLFISIFYMPVSVQRGVTLIETIFFIVVVSVALVVLMRVFNQSVGESVDPILRVRALELAQAQLDTILARKFDEHTPTGGVPACGTGSAPACNGIEADADYDDVGDFNGFVDNSTPGHRVSVQVTQAGTDLGLAAEAARLITVTVSYADDQLVLSAYKVNF